MAGLTTHILDLSLGQPARGVRIELRRQDDSGAKLICTATTNADGRCDKPLLSPDQMRAGTYELLFFAGDYFDGLGLDLPEPKFLDQIPLRFAISDIDSHYHVPLLLSPFGYSTYRGS
ncbi:MAG: hydroxyisourate hydrolase [Maricaulis sp.]|jgi:5-hydroxyisourate hydrolase|nr:hydroxyisourate hydrolase [Maricaulis sp.]MDG2043722.1 hydroxyisourate hydrolase [Maricaulis sp.]